MRRLLFRAWDTASKRMYPKFALLGETTCFDLISQWLDEFPVDKPSLERLNDVVVMQWTGLLDRKGVEIYEGDILAPSPERGKHGNRTCEYIDGSFCYSPPIGNKGWWALNQSKCKYFEVIGNIHQHPSLLSGGDQRGGTTQEP